MDSNTRLEEAARQYIIDNFKGGYEDEHCVNVPIGSLKDSAKTDFKVGAEWQAKELAGEIDRLNALVGKLKEELNEAWASR